MKIKKIQFSTCISDLYGKDKYQSHINIGNEYWYYFDNDSKIFQETHKHWNKIKITYIRSGCLFYVFPDNPNVEEEYCPVNCYKAHSFILAELNPINDLKELMPNIDSDLAKLLYCFNDERTIVNEWPNEKEAVVDEEELFYKFGNTADWLMIKMLEEK